MVLVATAVDDEGVVTAAEAGVAGLVRRGEASPERLVRTIIRVAAGEGSPAGPAGPAARAGRPAAAPVLAPRGLTFSGLASREIEVLRLVADGHDTAEIAASSATPSGP